MTNHFRPVCPIPHVGSCISERCNFWDEEQEECSGLCLGEYAPLEETLSPPGDWPCTLYWTEDCD